MAYPYFAIAELQQGYPYSLNGSSFLAILLLLQRNPRMARFHFVASPGCERLTRHGRDRIWCSPAPMSQPPHLRQGKREAEVSASEQQRGDSSASIDRMFTTEAAREKFANACPQSMLPNQSSNSQFTVIFFRAITAAPAAQTGFGSKSKLLTDKDPGTLALNEERNHGLARLHHRGP